MLHQMGAGALGPVFRVHQHGLDKPLALKLFRIDLPPERVHRLVAELEELIGTDLTHPAIAAPLAAGMAGVSAYLVREFVDADSLDVVIRERGPAAPADMLRLASGVAAALDFAATAEVLHGALHPRDVFVSSDGIRITGLGITGALERVVGGVAPVRRPYTAPERANGRAWDRRADVFGLAALIYELVRGRRLTATGDQIAASLARVPGDDGGTLGRVFARALAEDPADRFDTALAFTEALADALPRAVVASQRSSRVLGSPARLPFEGPGAVEPAAPIAETHSTTVEVVVERSSEGAPWTEELSLDAPIGNPQDTVQPAARVPARASPPLRALVPAVAVLLPTVFGAGYWVGSRALPGGSRTEARAVAAGIGLTVSDRAREPADTAVSGTPPLRPELSGPGVRPAPAAPNESDATGAGVPPVSVTPNASVSSEGRPTGRLLVRSTPAGARVLVDDRDEGLTPATLRGLPAGTHTVRVTRDGYVGQTRRVSVGRSQPSQSLSFELVSEARAAGRPAGPGPPTASLRVESRPTGARVFVDQRLVGTTPLVLGEVMPGSHVVWLELDGYRRWTAPVNVVAGRSRVAASLER